MIWSLSRTNFNRNIAVVIGINNYQNGIHPLKTAVNDAEAIANLLEQEYKYQTIRLFPGEHKDSREATLAEFNQLLFETLPKKIKLTEGDRLLFYFAGHGIAHNSEDGPAGYIVPQDAQLGKRETYLPMKKLNEALSQLECHHLLVVLDCCFAGNFRWSSHRNVIPELETIHREHFDRFIRYPAWQAITSAAHNQEALDYTDERGITPNSKHSPFAQALINGLTVDSSKKYLKADLTRDGVITAPELYLYLRDCLIDKDGYSELQTAGLWPLQKHDRGEFIFTLPGFVPEKLKPAPELNPKNNPYRGLESFDEEHSELFFGRTELIEELQKFIKDKALSVVLGASGSGKSSLVKAGLIPKLRQDKTDKWCILPPVRPGETPLIALNKALKEANFPEVIFTDSRKNLASSIKNWAQKNPNTKLLIFIDQSEEIITLCQDEEKRKQFFQQILTAIDAHRDKLRVVLSLRSDFEPQVRDVGFQFIPKGYSVKETELKNRWRNGRFMVSPMTRGELREAIQKPAEARVMFFQPQELVEEIVDEVAEMPGALPLLSFALSELYLKYLERQRQAEFNGIIIERTMIQEDYQELGGVILSLTQKADEEYQKLVPTDSENSAFEQVIRHVMLRMIALGGGELVRRRVPLSELEYPSEKQKLVNTVIDNFTDARLLVKGKDAADKAYVEPAHDALVSGWQKLLTWKQEYEESLLLQRRLTVAAQEWDERVRNKPEEAQKGILDKTDPVLDWLDGRLWTVENKVNKIPAQLSQLFRKSHVQKKSSREKNVHFLWNANPYLNVLNETLNSDENWLNQKEAKFVKQSTWQRRKNSSWRWRIAIAVILGLSGLTIWALYNLRNAQIEEINALRDTSDANLQSNNQLDAMINAIKAKKNLDNFWMGKNKISLQVMGILGKTVYHNQQRFREHLRLENTDIITSIIFSPNGKFLATASYYDETVQIWDVATGQSLLTLDKDIGQVQRIDFSPDGKLLATRSLGSAVQVWDIATGQLLHTLKHTDREDSEDWAGDDWPDSLVFSPDGKFLVTTSSKTVRVWNVATGKQLQIPTTESGGGIKSVVFSPDGKFLATTESSGKTVRVWNATTGKQQYILSEHDGEVNSIVFSPDSKFLVTVDNSIQVRDASTGKPLQVLQKQKGQVSSIVISPDSKRVAMTSSDNAVRLWNVETGRQFEILQGGRDDEMTLVEFSPDSQRVATSTLLDHTVQLWDASTGQRLHVLQGHEGAVSDIVFSPDSTLLTSVSLDDAVRMWDVSTGQRLQALRGHEDDASRILLSPDGNLLVTVEDRTIRVWNTATIYRPHDFRGHDSGMYQTAFSHDSKLLATASGDRTARLWDVETGEKLHILQGHEDSVGSVAFSPDGKLLATGSSSLDQTARIWDVETGEELHILQGHENYVGQVVFSPDGQLLATASGDRTARVWDVATGEPKHILQHEAQVSDVVFSPDGQHVVTGGGKTARVWDVATGKPKQILEHEDSVNRVVFSSDGKRLATMTFKAVRVWNVATQQWKDFEGHSNHIMDVVFSPDGKLLATASLDKTARLWDVVTGQQLHILQGHEDFVNSLVFSPDGKFLATSSNDQTARVWNAFTGEQEYILRGHEAWVSSVEFSPNGKWVATASSSSNDKTVRLWRVGDIEDLLAINCNWVRPYLKNNPNVSKSDRRLCDGVPSLNENSQNQ